MFQLVYTNWLTLYMNISAFYMTFLGFYMKTGRLHDVSARLHALVDPLHEQPCFLYEVFSILNNFINPSFISPAVGGYIGGSAGRPQADSRFG